MAKNFISVIIPCFNQAHYLEDSLTSILSQTYKNWECIIINDGSTDNTEEISKLWCKKDERFIYVKKNNGGLSSARNAGLIIAKGSYIQFLDADDLLSANKFENTISIFNDNLTLDIVFTNFKMFRNNLNSIEEPIYDISKINFTFETILFNWDLTIAIPIHCAILKRTIIKDVLFNETLFSKEDWVFWTTIFLNYPKVHFINKYESFYRINNNGLSKQNSSMYENSRKAFIVILNTIPNKYEKQFLLSCLDRLHNNYLEQFNYSKFILNTKSYLIGNYLVRIFNSLKISFFFRYIK
jgi:glycosyltransferase involved in cell wall biosynthesis